MDKPAKETDPDPLKIITLSPVDIPLNLKTGVDQTSPEYFDTLCKLLAGHSSVNTPSEATESRAYQATSEDSRDLKLFEWQADTEGLCRFHIYPNGIAVCELVFELQMEDSKPISDLESATQTESEACIRQQYPALLGLLNSITADPNNQLFTIEDPGTCSSAVNIHWTARALVFSRKEIDESANQVLVKKWLANTKRPADAEDIISGKRDASMTWVNYVFVDPKLEKGDDRIDAMILCQYLYSAQEKCNRQLKKSIETAYSSKEKIKTAKAILEESRVSTQLHQIAYNEVTNYLTRTKRNHLEEILKNWEFERLIENGQQMVKVCSNRIQECQHNQNQRNSWLTDLLLVALSFFTVFELSIYLIEFSREMMSRPALDYHDSQVSFFFSLIAGIDADIMFASGFGLTVALILLYRFLKNH